MKSKPKLKFKKVVRPKARKEKKVKDVIVKMKDQVILEEVVVRVAGKGSEIVVSALHQKKPLDEFKIADKSGLTVNQLRNILYKLHEKNLVSFERKRDKKKGWFIYYWTINEEASLEVLTGFYEMSLEGFRNLLKSRKEKAFFVCPKGHCELSEEAALEQNFECIECGELLVLKDSKIEVRSISKQISVTENRIVEFKEMRKELFPKVKPRAKRRKKRKTKVKAKAKLKVKEKAKTKAKVKVKAMSKGRLKVKVKAKPKAKPKPKAQAKLKSKAKTKKRK